MSDLCHACGNVPRFVDQGGVHRCREVAALRADVERHEEKDGLRTKEHNLLVQENRQALARIVEFIHLALARISQGQSEEAKVLLHRANSALLFSPTAPTIVLGAGVQPDPRVAALVRDAAEATERFTDDELEAAQKETAQQNQPSYGEEAEGMSGAPKVPEGCLHCGSKWIGGHARPKDTMTPGLRVFYDCGASLSIKEDLGDGAYVLLFKNCRAAEGGPT